MATAIAAAPQKTIIEQLEEKTTLLSVNDVAKLLRESPLTIYRRSKRGDMPHLKIGYAVKFDPRELADWLKERHVG